MMSRHREVARAGSGCAALSGPARAAPKARMLLQRFLTTSTRTRTSLQAYKDVRSKHGRQLAAPHAFRHSGLRAHGSWRFTVACHPVD